MDLRALVVIANIAGAVMLFLFVGHPSLNDWKQARSEHAELLMRRDQEQKNNDRFEKLKVEVVAHREDLNRIQDIAPAVADPKTDIPQLVMVIQGIAQQSGVILRGVTAGSVSGTRPSEQAREGVPADQGSSGQAVVSRPLTIGIVATPRGLRTFLQNVATSLRILELDSVSFTLDPTHEAADISITFHAYVFVQ